MCATYLKFQRYILGASDQSLRKKHEEAAASYEKDVPKANMEWICKDSLADYNPDEDNNWSKSCGVTSQTLGESPKHVYLCRNLNVFTSGAYFPAGIFSEHENHYWGPATLPTCTDYESAVKQFVEADKKRQEKIDRNMKALKTFGEQEMQRMLEVCDEEEQREEEMVEEVLNC